MLVWTLIAGIAVNGEVRTIARVQRADSVATNRAVACSSFYDRSSPVLATLLSALLKHAFEEIAVPHTIASQFELLQEVLIVDTTVYRFYRLFDTFSATHANQSGAKLHIMQNTTKQTIE